MAFVNEITIEQKSLMPSYQKKWQEIAFSINRLDRQTAIESVQSAYQLLELPMPEIQFFDSLYAAAKVAKPLYKDSYFTDDGFAHATELIAKLHEKLYINNEEAIGHWDSLVASELTPGDTQQIDRQLSESLSPYLSEGKSENFLSYNEYMYWFLPLNWYANESAFFDFHFSVASHTLFQPYDNLAWEVFQKLVKSCGWIIPFDKICLVCDRPIKFLFDSENRLHVEGEAAVEFADGNGLYSYHGVTIPEKYGKLKPSQWQPKWLLEETNLELKLILVQAITANSENYKTRYFEEALETAASLGKLAIVQQILATEKDKIRSLSNALAHGVWSRDIKIIQALIEAGASLNCRTEWGTPLIAAARTGDIRIIHYLIEAGADPNMWIDDSGYMSPLLAAVYEGHQEACDYLLPLITNREEIEYAQRELPKSVDRIKIP